MSNVFCTISTQSHLYKVFALADSLPDYQLHTLIVDQKEPVEKLPANVVLHDLSNLKSKISKAIINKYRKNNDKLRWSLKPCFLEFLLGKYEKVIYVDNDIYFYNSPDFLFDELNEFSVLLTPHHYQNEPLKRQNWLEAILKMGLYNAGFFAANRESFETINWWAKCCLYRCEKNAWRGLWDDQKYLDLMPVAFPGVKVLSHKGCNVAEWNKEICKRTVINGEVKINEQYPLVFYHFNGFSIKSIVNKKNHVLKSYFDEYLIALKKHKPSLKIKELYYKTPWIDKIKLQIWQWLNTRNEQTYRK